MMELDKIKSGWQNLEVKSVIDEEKLKNILKKRGQSAHSSLMRWEIFGIIVLICMIPVCVSFFLSEKLYIAVYLALACVIGAFWQLYKIKFLKGIDILNMPVTKVAPMVAKYRKYLQNEMCIGLIWFVIWVVLAIMSRDLGSQKNILVSVFGVVCILLVIYLYNKIYVNKIKKINQSLEELREFEKEN